MANREAFKKNTFMASLKWLAGLEHCTKSITFQDLIFIQIKVLLNVSYYAWPTIQVPAFVTQHEKTCPAANKADDASTEG